MDQPCGADRAGAGGLPHHHRGHHHHGQRGRHRRHLGGDDALPVALCGLPLPDPGGGPEHGLRQGQGSAGGEILLYYSPSSKVLALIIYYFHSTTVKSL